MSSAIETSVSITDVGARQVAEVVAAAGPTIRVWEATLPTVGRPRQWTVRQMLTLFLLNACTFDEFQLKRIPALVANLSAKQRRILGLPGRAGDGLFTLRQLGTALTHLARAIDTHAPELDDSAREGNEDRYQRIGLGLLAATIPVEVARPAGGRLAIDATKVASWGKAPVQSVAPPPVPESDDTGFYDPPDATTTGTPAPTPSVDVDRLPSGRRRRRDAGRRAVGACWMGANHARDVFYGYQHHVGVLVTDPQRTRRVPNLAVFCNTGAATANPAAMTLGQLAAYDTHRRRTGAGRLDEVLADGGYTQIRVFVDELRHQGVELTFKLHSTNQQGVRGTGQITGARSTDPVMMIDGRPYCACAPDPGLVYPWQDYDKLPEYWKHLSWRTQWALREMGPGRGDTVRFRTPHHGQGCIHCDHLPADEQCCQQATHTIAAEQLRLAQREIHGSPEWMTSYARRTRVEGFFADFKTQATSGVFRATARFFEFGKTALAALFRVAAVNVLRVNRWRAEQRKLGQIPDVSWHRPPLKRFMPARDPGSDEGLAAAFAPRKRGRQVPPALAHLLDDP